MRFRALCLTTLVSVAAPASAQSIYVAGGVGADIFRPSGVEGIGIDAPRGGEAVAWSLRLGTAVAERWGVEIGFTRPAEIEGEIRQVSPLLANAGLSGLASQPGAALSFFSAVRTSRRNSTLDAIAWVAQRVSGRVDLIYLGGVAFNRTIEEVDFSFTPRVGILPIIAPTSTRTTTYGAGPVAGLEARLTLTTRAFLIPGIRLHGTSSQAGGWLVRPSVALGWRF